MDAKDWDRLHCMNRHWHDFPGMVAGQQLLEYYFLTVLFGQLVALVDLMQWMVVEQIVAEQMKAS